MPTPAYQKHFYLKTDPAFLSGVIFVMIPKKRNLYPPHSHQTSERNLPENNLAYC